MNNKPVKLETEVIQSTKNVIINIRNQPVILDSDLAEIYGVETKQLNQQIKRNLEKFPEDFRFLLSENEFEILKSQNVTSSSNWGGRRTLPYAFTEFGVLQAANVLRSELANKVSVFVIRAFVEMREIIFQQQAITDRKQSLPDTQTATPAKIDRRFNSLMQGIGPKIEAAIGIVLDSVIDPSKGTTVREEAQDILSESIASLKERLKKLGLENEEVAARITKILAEAESVKATTRKTQAETDQLEFINMIRKLRLVIEARQLFIDSNIDSPELNKLQAFTAVLKELTE